MCRRLCTSAVGLWVPQGGETVRGWGLERGLVQGFRKDAAPGGLFIILFSARGLQDPDDPAALLVTPNLESERGVCRASQQVCSSPTRHGSTYKRQGNGNTDVELSGCAKGGQDVSRRQY